MLEALESRELLAAEFTGPLSSWLNVVSYGADPTGTNDSTAAFQNALNAANTANFINNVSPDVYVPAGTYKISSTLAFNYATSSGMSGTSLIGANASTTALDWTGPANGTMISILGMSRWQVERLTLNGENVSGTTIIAGGSLLGATHGQFNNYNFITDDIFENATTGFLGGNGDGYTYGSVSETTVERCQFNSISEAAIQLANFNSLDWWIWDSTFSHDGIGITNSTYYNPGAPWCGDFTVTDSTFIDSTVADVMLGNGGVPQAVDGCFSTGSARFIWAYGDRSASENLSVQDCTVLNPASTAIELQDNEVLTSMDNKFSTTSSAIVLDVAYQNAEYVPSGNLLSIGDVFSYSGSPVIGGTRVMEINDETGQTVTGTTPAPAAFLPTVTRELFNAVSYGADPSGADDSTAAIQDAINAAVTWDNDNGGNNAPIVYIPVGDYKVSSTLVVPNESDVQIVGDGSGWVHDTELLWWGTPSPTAVMLNLGSQSHAVVKNISMYGDESADDGENAATLIQVNDADQPGGLVYIDGGQLGTYATVDAGLVSDGLDNTKVQAQNLSWAAGVRVVGGPQTATGVATPGITEVYGGTGDGAQGGTGAQPTFAIQNGGKLLVSSYWREGLNNAPIFNLSGSGLIAVQSMMDSDYPGGDPVASIQANNFNGDATFVNTDLVADDASQFDTTNALVSGNQPTQLLVADDPTWTSTTLVNNLSNAAANAVALNNTYDLPDNTGYLPANNEGAASAAWLLNMLAPLRTDLPQPLGAEAATGVTDVQVFNVNLSDSADGLYIYGTSSAPPVTTPPAAPSALTATTISNTQINLTWTVNSNNQSGFVVQRATNSGFTTGLVTLATTGPNAWSWNDTTAAAGTTYYYRVLATNAIGNSTYSASASAKTFYTAAPTALTAVPASTSQINLSWTGVDTSIVGYNVYRSTTTGGENYSTPLNSTLLPATTTSYSDTGLNPGVLDIDAAYFYTVEAVTASGNDAVSNEVEGYTQTLGPVTGLTATDVSATQINLTWNGPVSYFGSTSNIDYNIYRGTTPGGENYATPIASSLPYTTTTWSDTSALPGVTYYYTARAIAQPWTAAGDMTYSSNETTAQTGLFTNDLDIGGPTPAGSASYANSTGTYTLSGGGTGLGTGTSDEFNYDFENYTGSGTFIAKVASLTGASTEAGLMFRASTAASEVTAEIIASGGAVWFGYRTTAGSASAFTDVTQATPIWLKLIRNGTGFSGYYSTNDTTWTQVGTTVTLANMPTAALVGLEVSSDVQGTSGTGTFTNVSLTPLAPADVAAVAASVTTINLTWTPVGGTVTGYNVYRGTTPGGENYASPLNGGTLVTGGSYSDATAVAGTTYYYTVEAVSALGSSGPSVEFNAVSAVTNLSVTTFSATQVNLTWTAATGAVTGYNIYRGLAPGAESPTPINSSPVTTTSYSDTTVTPGTTYYYTVEAVNAVSPLSLPGLAAYYPLDGTLGSIGSGATIADSSGNKLNGTMTTTGAAYVAGKFNQAVNFSGSQYVSVPYSPALNLSNNFSVSSWIYFPTYPSANNNNGIIGTRFGGDDTFDMKYISDDGIGNTNGPNDGIAVDIGNGTSWLLNATADVLLSAGTWYMVACTVSPTGCTIYLNGVTLGSFSFAGSPLFMKPGQTMGIGNDSGTTEYLTGTIDDVAVFGGTLTQPQIATLFASLHSSVASNERSALTYPAAPLALLATPVSGSASVTLTWETPGGTIQGYDIYRGTTPGGESTTPLNSSLITGLTYTDTTAAVGTKYYYTVEAVNSVSPLQIPGLTAYYTMDGTLGSIASGATVADSSGDGLNGTTTATGASYVAGKFNQAINFSGSQYVSVPYSSDLNLSSNFSVSSWIYFPTYPSANNNNGIIGTRFGSDDTFDMKYVSDDGAGTGDGIAVDIGNGTSWLLNNTAQVQLSATTWYMVSCTVTSTGCTIYLNGSLMGSFAYSGTPLFMKSGQTMGIGDDAGSEYLTGDIDDVIVAGVTLSPSQVYALYATEAQTHNSVASNEGNALTYPGAPTALAAAVSASTTQLNLSWTSPSGTVTGYNIYRGTSSGGENYSSPVNGSTLVTTTAWSDTGLTAGTAYYYTVKAVNPSGNSVASTQASQTTNTALTLPSSLVAYWDMNEDIGSTVYDTATGGTVKDSGTITGATWTTSGKLGNAMSFSGSSQYVTVSSSADLNITSNMVTLEVWARSSASTWNIADPTFLARNNSYEIGPYGTIGFQASIYVGGAWKTATYTPGSLTITSWNEFAVVYNGSTIQLYLNGAAVGTATSATGNLTTNTNALYLGRDTASDYFKGSLDEVRVYNSAQSASNISALYSQTALSVTSVTNGTAKSFALVPGTSAQYSDASYTFTSSATMNQFTGATYVQTANANRLSTANQLVSFKTNTPTIVYILYDTAITGANKASWLSDLTDTGTSVTNSNGHTFEVYEKILWSGTLWLGGNLAAGATDQGGEMYSVLLQPLCWNSSTKQVV